MNYLNKAGKPTATTIEKVTGFSKTCKLSDCYNSRSTNYHSIYNSDLFIIERDTDKIVAAGFHPLTKAIISLNLENKYVKQILAEYEITKAKAAEIKKENEKAASDFKASILAEADCINIDVFFKENVEVANKLEGVEKSKAMGIAMKALLSRNGIELLKTDFWQVFRILKSKSEKI